MTAPSSFLRLGLAQLKLTEDVYHTPGALFARLQPGAWQAESKLTCDAADRAACAVPPPLPDEVAAGTAGWGERCTGSRVGEVCHTSCRMGYVGVGYFTQCVRTDTWGKVVGHCSLGEHWVGGGTGGGGGGCGSL